MQEDLKRRLVSCSLLLSLMLTGCGEEDNSKNIYVGKALVDSTITYSEDGVISGTISADDVDKYIKIVTFKRDDLTFTRLVAIEDHSVMGGRGVPSYRLTKYVDLDTSTTLIHYTNPDSSGENTEHLDYKVGENLEVVSERDFMPYLYEAEKFQDEYDISELINFYHENVEETLTEEDKLILS